MIRRLVLFGLPVVIAAVFGFAPVLAEGGGDVRPRPVALVSDAPSFSSVGELVAASDQVVLAEIVGEAPGRTLSTPGDPDAGVRTRLLELRVVAVLVGQERETIVLEEEAALLDGTPVVVDGVRPAEVGERGVFFLVAGGSEAAPHHALVGPQGRFLVVGDALESAGDDPLSRSIADAGGPALRDAVLDTRRAE